MRRRASHNETASNEAQVNYVSLSKAMSKTLRHQPERLGLTLAADGSVEVETLVEALNRRGGWPRTLTADDIMHVVEHGTKERFAVDDGRIRARYGHSIPLPVSYELAEPPATLYHGTSRDSVTPIMAEGLRPMGRQVVHLSTDVETATLVGRRHGRDVVILSVDAGRAWQDGVSFYRGNDATWLADHIPPDYLAIT